MRGERPRLFFMEVSLDMMDRAGMEKARVLPEPVSAIPTTSRWRPVESDVSWTGYK